MQIINIIYLLTILISIQLTIGYVTKTESSENDEDIIHSFGFTVHMNPEIKNAKTTFAKMDKKHNVFYLKIAYEKCIPSSIYRLRHLSILEIVNTNFCHSKQRIPADIVRLAPSLTELHISGTRITHIPNEIGGEFKHLHKLVLFNVGLKALPNSIVDLPVLKTLILSNNSLSTLPKNMTNLQSLEELTLRNNLNLRSIKSLNGHPSLRILDTRHCPIEALPHNLSQLMKLYMTNNRLRHLIGIQSLGNATNGNKEFDFDGNHIEDITPRIHHVRNLSRLNLRHNLLEVLPEEIFNIPTLAQLDIRGNPFPPRDLDKYICKFNTTNPNMKLLHDRSKFNCSRLF